jgi:uncharacterized damage-inducible protein DinB
MASMEPSIQPSIDPSIEPWLRGSESDVPAVGRGVLHALQLAAEDLRKWCSVLSDEQLNTSPAGAPPVAFHIRHLARSMDRLLTYAEAGELSKEQMALLRAEGARDTTKTQLFTELTAALNDAAIRVRAIAHMNMEEPRTVGRKRLPTTVGGLVVHVADHTQRHVGQAITTARVVAGLHADSGTEEAV